MKKATGTGKKPLAVGKPKQSALAPLGSAIYQLKITLCRSHTPIWRRVQVPADVTLEDLHVVIQIAMGWTDSHLHCFRIGGASYSSPSRGVSFQGGGDESGVDVFLDEVCRLPKTKFAYEYDFGDGWVHEILLEKIFSSESGVRYPYCLTGKGACPPEDSGGVYGYSNWLAALGDSSHAMHEDAKDWLGEDWDAKAFDLNAVNAYLAHLSSEPER